MLSAAAQIVTTLREAGHTAYFAGGFVRDTLLGRPVSDIDIATSAQPVDIERIFPRTHPVGREFGVMIVQSDEHAFEVATFRGESDYDGRRPGKVFFTDAEHDARRRDFTINGMFYDPTSKQVLDYVGGQHDLKLRVIRAIGNPEERFAEDHLRLLRAVRIRNALGFAYEPATERAIQHDAHLIRKISAERIRVELTRMLVSPHPAESIRDLDRLGLLPHLIPELTRLKGQEQPIQYHEEGDAFTHSLAALNALSESLSPSPPSITTSLAVLFHDLGKAETGGINKRGEISFHCHADVGAQIAGRILRRLKFDNATREKTCWLIHNHMLIGDITKMRRSKQHAILTHPFFPDLLQVFLADIRGSLPCDESLYAEVVSLYEAEQQRLLLEPPKTLLTAQEIMQELGVPPGPELGRLKQLLYDATIEKIVTTPTEALRFLEKELKR